MGCPTEEADIAFAKHLRLLCGTFPTLLFWHVADAAFACSCRDVRTALQRKSPKQPFDSSDLAETETVVLPQPGPTAQTRGKPDLCTCRYCKRNIASLVRDTRRWRLQRFRRGTQPYFARAGIADAPGVRSCSNSSRLQTHLFGGAANFTKTAIRRRHFRQVSTRPFAVRIRQLRRGTKGHTLGMRLDRYPFLRRGELASTWITPQINPRVSV